MMATTPENLEDQKKMSVEDVLNDAITYAKDLSKGQATGRLDEGKLNLVIAEASLSRTYRNNLEVTQERLEGSEGLAKELLDQIKALEDKLKDFRTREATHAGMCSAFQTALFTVAQGHASGGSK